MQLDRDLRSHWTLDPKVCFLNHGSYGAVLAEIQEVQQDYRDRLEREPVDFLQRAFASLLDNARARVAQFVGARPGGLVFTDNATAGVNAVLRSLTFEPGDELVCTNHAYNACSNVLHHVANRFGAKVVVAQVPFPLKSEDEVVEAIESVITGRTKIALVDHVTSPTGLVFPIQRIVDSLKERGVDTLVDGAHGPGMLPLNLHRLGAAYYVANGHKWLCAPKAVGFLYVREDRAKGITPVVISHGANSKRAGYTRLQNEFDWPGTIDPTPILCLPESIEALGRLVSGGWPKIYERNHALARHGRDLLCKTLGVETPTPDSMVGNLAAVPLPDLQGIAKPGAFESDPLHNSLRENHGVEIPVVHYPGDPGRLIRLSAHLHNRVEDYGTLVKALGEEMAANTA